MYVEQSTLYVATRAKGKMNEGACLRLECQESAAQSRNIVLVAGSFLKLNFKNLLALKDKSVYCIFMNFSHAQTLYRKITYNHDMKYEFD